MSECQPVFIKACILGISMAVNQAKIFEQLELIASDFDREEFIYGFMSAFDFPKATITQVRQGGARNGVVSQIDNA